MALAARRALLRARRAPSAAGGVQRPHALSARPRPDPPLEAVPAAEGEDPGLHRSGRRPLPHADDPHARDDRNRARRRPRAAAERGPRRGDRPRARHGPPAFRPRRRGGTRRSGARALRRRVQAQRALAPDRGDAQPDSRSQRRDPHPHGRARAGHARGQDRAARGPGRLHQPRHRRRDPLRHPRCEGPAPRGGRAPRLERLRSDRHARPRPRRALRAGRRHRPGRGRRRGDAVAALVHVRTRLPRAEHARPARAGPRLSSTGSSNGSRRRVAPRRRSWTISPG